MSQTPPHPDPSGERSSDLTLRNKHRKNRPADLSHLRPGDIVEGTYELIEEVEHTAQGVSWKARDLRSLNRSVLLKLFSQHIDQYTRERCEREAMLGARLQHPNIIALHDSITLDSGARVIVFEYLMGEPLSLHIRREIQLNAWTSVHIAQQLARALDYLHQMGLVYQALTPSSVMLTPLKDPDDLQVKLIDLGRLKPIHSQGQSQGQSQGHGQRAQFLDDPTYMSPEQDQGQPLTPRSDLYSIGVLLFEMLAGKPPFRCVNWAIFSPVRPSSPPPDVRCYCPWELPLSLVTVVNTCLKHNPSERYASATELIMALDKI